MAYASRVKDALDDIVTELGDISTSNGYYTDPTIVRAIRDLDRITSFPEIGIEMGREKMRPIDTKGLVWDSDVDVLIVAAASAASPLDSDSSELVDATEALRHDLKRVFAEICYKYGPNSSGQLLWNIRKGEIDLDPVMGLGERQNRAIVAASFTIHVRRMGKETLTSGHGETYGEAGAGYYGF